MLDSSVADQMARLTLKLLEKKLQQEREDVEGDSEDPHLMPGLSPGHEDPPDTALQSALRTRRDLLQRLWEQHLADKLLRTWRGPSTAARGPVLSPQLPPGSYGTTSQPLPAPELPLQVIQHQVPQPPTTIILTAPPLSDMVEMLLLQAAQMHQVIMQSLMLQALPPSALAPSRGPPAVPRAEKRKPPSVHHHHHHYAPPAPLQAVPAPGSPAPYSVWSPVVPATALPPAASFLPTVRHVTGPPAAALSAVASDDVLPAQVPGV
nr:PREDICTED: uncharacterized protein C21orf58 homolog [Rhinolophus sinicus]